MSETTTRRQLVFRDLDILIHVSINKHNCQIIVSIYGPVTQNNHQTLSKDDKNFFYAI